MSEHQPPSGTPEYLEPGSGVPTPPEAAPPESATAPRRSRRAWWIGGGVLLLAGAGAGAWAAMSFFQQGAQPAEALPSTTAAYLSLDLDPSGGQKIDAFRTLNKFPAFKDEVGIDSVDQLRHKVGTELVGSSDCAGLDFDRDIDPWLGDRMAVAAVMIDGKPQLVGVVQVKDDDKARNGIAKLNGCDDSDAGDAGFSVHDGWAVLAQSQKVADEVVDATADGSLADDSTYQKWTKEVGDAGVLNAYASPDAGKVLSQAMSGLFSDAFGGVSGDTTFTTPDQLGSSAFGAGETGSDNPFGDALAHFKGGAATLRFTGNGLELAVAGDGSDTELSQLTTDTGGALVRRLPDDTAAALGTSIPKGAIQREFDAFSHGFGMTSGIDLRREIARSTGLRVPRDLETLLGSGVALSVGHDLDLEAAENSPDGSGIPVAATVQGDPDAIGGVLDKIRSRVGEQPLLGSDSSDDLVVVGPSDDYRQQVLKGGSLGDQDVFTNVVPDAADASSVFFLDLDALEPAIAKLAPAGDDSIENLKPLHAVGISSWNDDGITRFSFTVTTN